MINYIKEFNGISENLKFLTVHKNDSLYHGSYKLFVVQKLIDDNRKLIDEYLNRTDYEKLQFQGSDVYEKISSKINIF